MAAVITFDEISGRANVVMGTAKIALTRLRRQQAPLRRFATDWRLLPLLHQQNILARMFRGIEPAGISDEEAQKFFANYRAVREELLPLFQYLKAHGNRFERVIGPMIEAAWEEIEDFAESMQLSHNREFMKALDQVASGIPQLPPEPGHDWRAMLAKL